MLAPLVISRRTFLAAASSLALTVCAPSRSGDTMGTPTTGAPSPAPPPPGPAPVHPARFVASGASPDVAFTFHGSGDPALLHALLAAVGGTDRARRRPPPSWRHRQPPHRPRQYGRRLRGDGRGRPSPQPDPPAGTRPRRSLNRPACLTPGAS